MKKLIFVFVLLIAQQAHALLPPLYETLAEYRSLINSKELENKLPSGQAIEKIIRTNDGFEVITPKYVLKVDVVYEKTDRIGPARFHLEFQELKTYHE